MSTQPDGWTISPIIVRTSNLDDPDVIEASRNLGKDLNAQVIVTSDDEPEADVPTSSVTFNVDDPNNPRAQQLAGRVATSLGMPVTLRRTAAEE